MSSRGLPVVLIVAGIACAAVVSLSGICAADVTFTDIAAGLPGVHWGSAAWGDYDSDGDLDILLTGYTGSGSISRVYRNDSRASVPVFTDIGAGLPGVEDGSAAWGDYDNDGDLDILLTGYTGSGSISRVYRNDGGVYADIGAGLPGMRWGSAAWGDYDNDGDLDILLTGATGSGFMSRVYRNDGGVFHDSGARLLDVCDGSAAWGDYDNDGDLDILLMGFDGWDAWSRVYRNDGVRFTDIQARLTGVYFSSGAWGDYDNDGDLDILLAGDTGSGFISRIYRNDGSWVFTDIEAGLQGTTGGSVAWGDYDNDGDLDIQLTGDSTGSGHNISCIYRSDGAPANTPPRPPTGLAASLVGDRLTLSWNASSDAQTPAAGLSYNLRVGTTPGGCEIVSPMALRGTGYRQVVQLGNAQQGTSWTIQVPGAGPYYWGVQAVDGAWAGSRFATKRDAGPMIATAPALPASFALRVSAAGRLNPVTTLSFDLPVSVQVDLAVFDVMGRRVRGLVGGQMPAGRHEVLWDGTSERGSRVASGVYYCRMAAGPFTETRPMALVR